MTKKLRALAKQSRAIPSMSNLEIVTLALYSLGGDQKKIDTEDVAVKADSLASGRFAWVKYPQHISLEHVRVALSDAKKQKNGALVAGNGTDGWSLTALGIVWSSRQSLSLGAAVECRRKLDKTTERRRRQELSRIMDLPAWECYSNGHVVSQREAGAVFRVSSYTPTPRKRELVERVKGLFVNDSTLSVFLHEMAIIVVDDY